MDPSDDDRLADLAIRRRFATRAQVEPLLRGLRPGERGGLGRLLVARGHLTGTQLEILESLLRRPQGVAPSHQGLAQREDEEFARMVLERGAVTPGQVDRALAERAARWKRGEPARLGTVLLAQGVMDHPGLLRLLEAQRRGVLICPGCLARFEVQGMDEDAAFECGRCHARLSIPRRLYDVPPPEGPAPHARAAEAPARPARLGGYELVERIAHGPMGEVYRAENQATGETVAVKVLGARLAAIPHLADRLVRTANAWSGVVHPNVVRVLRAARDGDRVYVLLEYAPGETAGGGLRRAGRLPPTSCAAIGRGAALGLAAAHAAGLVHRDVKPDNILLDPDRGARVFDFGVAYRQGRLGTPLYMPPEQWRDDDVDGRADVYALGMTLHVLLAGSPPFRAARASDMRWHHENTEVRLPLDLVREVPGSLASLVERMLLKRTEERPSAEEVARALVPR
ncbi:MAG: serine/threonine protein kinase [Planctomycetes bacterium]|nr:serine/threonine protein kinase [Planctomycetota bacterium]